MSKPQIISVDTMFGSTKGGTEVVVEVEQFPAVTEPSQVSFKCAGAFGKVKRLISKADSLQLFLETPAVESEGFHSCKQIYTFILEG
jgi:hypothetical protein